MFVYAVQDGTHIIHLLNYNNIMYMCEYNVDAHVWGEYLAARYMHTRDPKNVNNPVYSGHWSHHWAEGGKFLTRVIIYNILWVYTTRRHWTALRIRMHNIILYKIKLICIHITIYDVSTGNKNKFLSLGTRISLNKIYKFSSDFVMVLKNILLNRILFL